MRVGTAGWTLPLPTRDSFGPGASHLARYATRFTCAEINSTFYRSHRRATYDRWASIVPDDFRFSVKLPREITHKRQLIGSDELVDTFLLETSALGDKRGVLLVQLPPSFAFDRENASAFFSRLTSSTDTPIACEPRHPSWFDERADDLLASLGVARVAADPAVVPTAASPGGASSFAYARLHGSPRLYASAYDDLALRGVADMLRPFGTHAWCIFDNTQFGAATANALTLCAIG